MKSTTVIRIALTTLLLMKVYSETGWATSLILTLVALRFELGQAK